MLFKVCVRACAHTHVYVCVCVCVCVCVSRDYCVPYYIRKLVRTRS